MLLVSWSWSLHYLCTESSKPSCLRANTGANTPWLTVRLLRSALLEAVRVTAMGYRCLAGTAARGRYHDVDGIAAHGQGESLRRQQPLDNGRAVDA